MATDVRLPPFPHDAGSTAPPEASSSATPAGPPRTLTGEGRPRPFQGEAAKRDIVERGGRTEGFARPGELSAHLFGGGQGGDRGAAAPPAKRGRWDKPAASGPAPAAPRPAPAASRPAPAASKRGHESGSDSEDDMIDHSYRGAADMKLLPGEERVTQSGLLQRFGGLPHSSENRNNDCVISAASAARVASGRQAANQGAFDPSKHTDTDIEKFLLANGFTRADGSAFGRASPESPVWARRGTEDGQAWHAYTVLGNQRPDGKVLAFDPDAKVGGLKWVNPSSFDPRMVFALGNQQPTTSAWWSPSNNRRPFAVT